MVAWNEQTSPDIVTGIPRPTITKRQLPKLKKAETDDKLPYQAKSRHHCSFSTPDVGEQFSNNLDAITTMPIGI